jgi:hypothetical protein
MAKLGPIWSICDCPFEDCSSSMMSYKCKINLHWDELSPEVQKELELDLPGWSEHWKQGAIWFRSWKEGNKDGIQPQNHTEDGNR